MKKAIENYPRDIKGVWIPWSIYSNEQLSPLEIFIFTEIDSLDRHNNDGDYCYASNAYLADFCKCTERKVSDTISKLSKMGLIKIVKTDGRKRWIESCSNSWVEKNSSQPRKNFYPDKKKFPQSKIVDNNIDQNNKDFFLEKEGDNNIDTPYRGDVIKTKEKKNTALILQDQCLYIDNNEVVGESVFSEKENPTRKNTPVEETKRKPFKWENDSEFLRYVKNIVPRQIRQYCRENDHMDDYETLLDFVMDYFVKYKEATGKGHPPYRGNMFTEVFDSLYEYFNMFDYDTLVGCAEVFFDRASIKGRELKVFATENMLKYLYAELMCDYHEIMFE